jgi:inward rectifier potassium channel
MAVRVGAFELRKTGAAKYDWRDPYHMAVTASWRLFGAAVLAFYVAVHLFFATLYILIPGAVAGIRPGSLLDAFFFSIETLATMSFGSTQPATLWGHAIVSTEIVSGMAFTAIVTGLIFVRFSRPMAKVLYADKAVVAIRNGKPHLMIRTANGRASVLTNAKAKLAALMLERTDEGVTYRRPRDLQLDRDDLPIFALTWTLMHEIDAKSPLAGYTSERLAQEQVRFFLAIKAHDTDLNADVQDMKDYGPADVMYGWRYQDAVAYDAEGRTYADLTRISFIEEDTSTPVEPLRAPPHQPGVKPTRSRIS